MSQTPFYLEVELEPFDRGAIRIAEIVSQSPNATDNEKLLALALLSFAKTHNENLAKFATGTLVLVKDENFRRTNSTTGDGE